MLLEVDIPSVTSACLPRSPRSAFLFPSNYIPIAAFFQRQWLVLQVMIAVIPFSQQNLTKPSCRFEMLSVPLVPEERCSSCVWVRRDREEVNAFCLFFYIYF